MTDTLQRSIIGETAHHLDRISLLQDLESIRVWSEDDACVTRRTKVAVHGMPLHGWSISNVEKLYSAWGKVIEVDKGMVDTEDFQAPQATIDTASFMKIQDWAILEI